VPINLVFHNFYCTAPSAGSSASVFTVRVTTFSSFAAPDTTSLPGKCVVFPGRTSGFISQATGWTINTGQAIDVQVDVGDVIEEGGVSWALGP
jgi:hypothetical protein